MTSKDAMPSTTDFEKSAENQQLVRKPLPMGKFLLMEIENGNGKENSLNTETLTIEHIMPQALSLRLETYFRPRS